MNKPGRKSDSWLDKQLRDVSVPPGLVDRLQEITCAEVDDGEIDRRLCDVPVPAGLVERLERIAQRVPRRLEIRQFAAVACLMLAVGLGYSAALVGLLSSELPLATNTADGEPYELMGALDADAELLLTQLQPLAADKNLPPVLVGRQTAQPVELAPFVIGPRPDLQPSEQRVVAPIDPMLPDSRKHAFFVPEHWKYLSGSDQPALSVEDEWPEPELVAWNVTRGIAAPRERGFNLPFQIGYSVHPVVPVDPRYNAAQSLAYLRVPLRSETFSYELLRRYVQRDPRELPPSEKIRVEDFLAAVEYPFPAPRDEALSLYSTAMKTPFGGSGTYVRARKKVPLPGLPAVMQVGVRARDEVPGWRQACRLVVVVDCSRSMRRGGRLEMVRQGLEEMARRMGPADRVTLVSFADEANILVQDARADDPALLSAIRGLHAGSSTNLPAGMQLAYSVASVYSNRDRLARRVVLLSDGISLSETSMEQLERSLAKSVAQGIRLNVIDLSEEVLIDPQALRTAEAGGGRLIRARSGQQVSWALRETLTGRSQMVADRVTLRIEFKPGTVDSYRLLGHEATDVGPLQGAALEVPLYAGQSATTLVEIRPKTATGALAEIELRWNDPWGTSHKLEQTLRAEQITDFGQAPAAIQRAAVVAEAAEILRGSPFVTPEQTLSRLISDWGERVSHETEGAESFREFLELMRRVAEVRSKQRR